VSSDTAPDFTEYVLKLATICKMAILHGEYNVSVKVMDEPCEGNEDDTCTHMDVHIDDVYLWMRIRVYPEMLAFWKVGDYWQIADSMMHELCHLFIKPVETWFMWDVSSSQRDHVIETIERQTQRITNAMMKSLGNTWYLPENVL
jgi:hypothetical protein